MTTIATLVAQQKNFFAQGLTKNISWRKDKLRMLKKAIKAHEKEILNALYKDLKKPEFEAYTSEIYLCLQEIDHALKHLDSWARPTKVPASLVTFPSSSSILHEPYGIVVIIAPWNYPFQLTLIPLIGALAAGNCAIVKPSELSSHSALVIKDIVEAAFDEQHVTTVVGGPQETQELLKQPLDYIFFTGSTTVGKIVMQAAAEQLIPLTLELGGKNPCIVDYDAHLPTAAHTIAWGKFLNAGQSCVAPDYVLVHRNRKQEFVTELQSAIKKMYGPNPEQSPDYGRIINDKHVERLANLLRDTNIIIGGAINRATRYIAPTLVDDIDWQHPLMREEIFGPIAPIISFDTIDDVLNILRSKPKPLAIYLFCQDKAIQQQVIQTTSSGSVVINDVVVQAGSVHLPFGGVGSSGFGRYHGKASFTTFSNTKTVVRNVPWFAHFWRYPPYLWFHRFLKKAMDYWY